MNAKLLQVGSSAPSQHVVNVPGDPPKLLRFRFAERGCQKIAPREGGARVGSTCPSILNRARLRYGITIPYARSRTGISRRHSPSPLKGRNVRLMRVTIGSQARFSAAG